MDARGRWVLAVTLAYAGCESPNAGNSDAPAASTVDGRVLAELRRFEAERRAAADFGAAPPSEQVLGADPYVIRALGSDRFVGILRGAGALVLLDGELREVARAAAPASPSGLALAGDRAFVVGERASEIRAYRVSNDRIEVAFTVALPGARALRDVAAGPDGSLHAVEEAGGRLFTLVPSPSAAGGYEISERQTCAGAFRVARTKSAVVVDCLLAHSVVAYRVDTQGRPEGDPAAITNDGPLWSFSAIDVAEPPQAGGAAPTTADGLREAKGSGGGLLIATGGVENHPLDRTHGSFENIDSFVYVDRVAWQPAPHVTRTAEINVSEHGVVVPKALELERDDAGTYITVTGFGGEAFASIRLSDGAAAPDVQAFPLPPGTNAFARTADGGIVIANPLLDGWILYRSDHRPVTAVHVAGPGDATRSAASRLGEALIFTQLIAPYNRSNGPLSRFTCETCHFEGYVDGRTHATGRGDIIAATKPLLGLFNNRPHFSRALDPDLSSVAHNEFRVAGARSNHDPVFDLELTDRAYFADMGVTVEDLTAVGLRRAFMAFLMDFSHRSSALSAGKAAFNAEERRGAEVFRDRCEGCHEARLASDVPASRVPFDAWEAKVLSEAAPIVWGKDRYEQTGVTPYVHEMGARIPSLRRLYKKQPYLTNGTAKSLADVLERVCFGDGVFYHDGAPAEPPLNALTDEERLALEAFLRLL